MQRKVYLTKLKPEYREQYIEAHRQVAEELLRRYRDSGMTHCSVHLLGDTLAMIVDSVDHAAMKAVLDFDEVDIAWQKHVGPMKSEAWAEMEPVFYVDL